MKSYLAGLLAAVRHSEIMWRSLNHVMTVVLSGNYSLAYSSSKFRPCNLGGWVSRYGVTQCIKNYKDFGMAHKCRHINKTNKLYCESRWG